MADGVVEATNPSDAFDASFKSAEAAAQLWRHAKAQNALAAAYGPTVTSLQDAQQQQTLNLNDQLNPLKVQQTQEDLNQSQAMDPLKVQNQQLQNDNQGLQNTQAGQTIDATNMSLQATKALQIHGVLSASLDTLGKQLATVTDPNQRGALFDAEIQQLAPLIGADPRVIAPQLRAERDRIVKDGADAVPLIQGDLDNLIQGQLSPIDRQKLANAQTQQKLTQAQIGKTNAQADAATSNAKATSDKAAAAIAKAGGKNGATLTPEQAQAMGTVMVSMQQTMSSLDDAEKDVNAMSSQPLLAKARALIPGTPEANFARATDQIGHANAINDLRTQKQLGLSLGRTTNTEFLAAAQALANMDITQPKSVLLRNIKALRDMYSDKMTDAQAQIDASKAAASKPAAAASGGAATYTFNPDTGDFD